MHAHRNSMTYVQIHKYKAQKNDTAHRPAQTSKRQPSGSHFLCDTEMHEQRHPSPGYVVELRLCTVPMTSLSLPLHCALQLPSKHSPKHRRTVMKCLCMATTRRIVPRFPVCAFANSTTCLSIQENKGMSAESLM